MRDAPTLRTLEQQLFELIRAPASVAQGLERLGIEPAAVERLVAGDERLDALGRVGIYADMYFLRLLDVLRGAFPKVLAAVGDEAFAALASGYIDRHPSRHPSLRHLGDRFAGYLAQQDDVPPWLGELAALEWARDDVFDETDADPLTREQLATYPPEAFAALPLAIVPAHRLVVVEHAVERVWRALSRGEETCEPEAGSRTLLVWRQDRTVFHRALDPTERDVWPLLVAGTTFGLICEELGRRFPHADEAAQLSFTLLVRLVDDGLLRRPPRGTR